MNKLFADLITPGGGSNIRPTPNNEGDALPIIIAVSAIVIVVVVVVSVIIAKIISNKNGKKRSWYSIRAIFCINHHGFDRVGVIIFFLHSKTDRRLVILVQCLTNPVLNTLLLINDYFEFLNRTILIIILELCVVTIEAVIYKKGHVDTKIDPFLLSLFLNLASVCTGLLFYQFAN